MKTIKLIAIAVISALAIASCSKQDPDALTVASSSMSFSSDGGAQTVSFATNVQWTASADKDWISVSPDKGEAGNATVTITVGENDSFQDREGNVTVKAGAKTTVFKVCQTYAKVFEAGTDIALDFEAQEFVIATKANVDLSVEIVGGEGWLTQAASTKAAPVESNKKFKVAENVSAESRQATVKISSDSECIEIKVTQGSNPNAAEVESIEYIGSKQRIYDTENWTMSTFCQWVVELKNDEALTRVTIVFNGVKAQVESPNVPAGEYEVDATGTHADKTISIKSLDGVEKKYTTVVIDGKEIEIVDGNVSVAEDGSINAVLYDDPGNAYSFFTSGAMPDVVINPIGAQIQSVSYKANYNTYFANNNNEWYLTLYFSEPVSSDVPYLSGLGMDIFGNADGELDPAAFPVGTYTIKASETKDSGYANGNVIADPFTIEPSEYNTVTITADSTTYAKVLGGSVVISKEGDAYSFEFKLQMQKWHTDEDWNPVMDEQFDYVYKYTDVSVISVDNNGLRPNPDGDITLTKWGMTGGYSGMWFGNSYSLLTDGTTPNSVFILGDTAIEGGAYYFQAVLNTSGAWIFEKNFANRYCSTKIPAGVYPFTAVKPEVASDFLAKNAAKREAYRAIENSYTGTYFYYDGGNITITNDEMIFGLTATSKGDEAHGIAPKKINISGTLPNNCYYFRDYSAAKYQTYVEWYTE